MHWLAAHSSPDLVAAERLSARSHGRWLWRRLRMRINELEEAQVAVRVLETIGPYLSERRPHRTDL